MAWINHSLIFLFALALAVYLWARPGWRNLGPSLIDSYIIGISLFAIGSVLVWTFTSIPHAVEVMRIGLAAGISGAFAAALWSRLLRARTGDLRFFQIARGLRAGTGDRFAITLGLLVCALVCAWFLVQVFTHENLRSLLLDLVLRGKGTFTQARLIMSSGAEGYFAPGYVKQFRDILVPILCVAALLCHGSYSNKPVFYGVLAITLVAIFVTGQRLALVLLLLVLLAGFVLDVVVPMQRRLMPFRYAIPMFLVMAGLVVAMTEMLGRVDMPLVPVEHRAAAADPPAPPPQAPQPPQEAPQRAAPPAAQPPAQTAQPQPAPQPPPPPPPPSSPTPTRSLETEGLPRSVAAIVSLAHRSIMAAPQENAISYPHWGPSAPTMGRAWAVDLASIRPGVQTQLSNELSEANRGGSLGNSPLGLAPDLYHNWGIAGVILFAAIYGLLFLLLDILLTASRSPLLFASKVFLFFSIPLMYSPFFFLLYGGAVVLALVLYVTLLRMGALSFMGLSAAQPAPQSARPYTPA